ANEAADGGDFGDTRNGFELITQMPILEGPQIGKIMFAAVVNNSIFIDPACSRCVRTDCRMYICWKTSLDGLQILEDPRARPIHVSAVLKYNEDVRIVEHGLRTDGFDARSSQKRRDNGIRNLVFDDVGRLTFPVRVNNDLDIGDVGQRVERNVADRPDAGEHQQGHARKHEEPVVRAPLNDPADHLFYIPPVALTLTCLLASSCPFCDAVSVTCQVPPDPRSPVPSYIPPP